MNLVASFGIALILFYILSGIISYGLLKGRAMIMYSRNPELRHGSAEETWCVVAGLLGPIGLIIVLQICLSTKTNFILCYRMPKEFCELRLYRNCEIKARISKEVLDGTELGKSIKRVAESIDLTPEQLMEYLETGVVKELGLTRDCLCHNEYDMLQKDNLPPSRKMHLDSCSYCQRCYKELC